jgi:hypothetical protein
MTGKLSRCWWSNLEYTSAFEIQTLPPNGAYLWQTGQIRQNVSDPLRFSFRHIEAETNSPQCLQMPFRSIGIIMRYAV